MHGVTSYWTASPNEHALFVPGRLHPGLAHMHNRQGPGQICYLLLLE